MEFVWRGYSENDPDMDSAIKDPNLAVILNVNRGQHWVVALHKTLFGKDYVCLDPWTGKKCDAKATYHDITGYAKFKRV